MRQWNFYDAAGVLRKVVKPRFYDAAGVLRKIVVGYFYDDAGVLHPFFGFKPITVDYTTPGTYAATTPAGATLATIEIIGGGGGAGRGTNGAPSGGASGAAYIRLAVPLTASVDLTIIVGAGGLGATINSNAGAAGENSYVALSPDWSAQAGYGYGGRSNGSAQNSVGLPLLNAITAVETGNGQAGTARSGSTGGLGGGAGVGTGEALCGAQQTTQGGAGNIYGGGGTAGNAMNGGNGANGIVRIKYT